MDRKAMIAEAKGLYEQCRAILQSDEPTAEDIEKVPRMRERAEELKARLLQMDEIEAAAAAIANVPQAPLAQTPNVKDNFETFGGFLHAAWKGMNPRFAKEPFHGALRWYDEVKDVIVDTKVMVESVGASGGFLVPPEHRTDLQSAIGEMAIVRPRAQIIRMARRQVTMPVLDQTGTTAGRTHWHGGLVFYWTEEAASKTASDASFRDLSLVAHKLIGYTQASDELVSDSAISLEDFFRGPMGYAGGVAWTEDYAFLRGTGAGQPLGIINAGATITVNRTATMDVQYGDLTDMLMNFMPNRMGVWIISQSCMARLLEEEDTAGNLIWGDMSTGRPNTLLGMPVVFSEKVPTLGTAGDVVLADFSYYVIGDRQATTIESTQYDAWSQDKTSWRVVHRVDGKPWMSAPFTLSDGTSQVSPFVILGDKTT